MNKIIILVGRSGSGKGTQAQFIKNFLEKNYPDKKSILVYITKNLGITLSAEFEGEMYFDLLTGH